MEHRNAEFQTTSWGLVLTARDRDSAASRDALAVLCKAYWQPLYVFVRRQGYSVDEARDLTQAFFTHLLEKQALQNLEPGPGRLRSFLLVSLKNLLADERTLHLATDWAGYAEHIDEVFASHPRFDCAERREHDGERALDRPQTKFERRGLRHGHRIHDWRFVRTD